MSSPQATTPNVDPVKAKSPAKSPSKSPSVSPPPRSPSATASPPQLPGIIAAAENDEDGDSALGDDSTVSIASLASSVLHYRTIQGRTFHSDRFTDKYYMPNDSNHQESLDITHHYHTLSLDGKLYLAPIPDTVKEVVDIGTGTGIWAIDFADEHPEAHVVGTDISPIQPIWVPPNLQFEVDDATIPWTWHANSIDFVHIRYMLGAIPDWYALFAEAYRVCAPGGWIESCEVDAEYQSDDGTLEPAYQLLWELYDKAGQKMGHTCRVLKEDLQRKGMEAAGFVNVNENLIKVPMGGWPADPRLSEIGNYCRLATESDIEGYTLYMWNNVMGWDKNEYQIFLANLRKALKNPKAHCYCLVKRVWAQKPE